MSKALLHGKRISIRVRDARLGFDFCWKGQRFAPSQPYAEADLTISANAQDFLLLAQRRQTLTRRLQPTIWSWKATPNWAWW